jgi:hypothetical protein
MNILKSSPLKRAASFINQNNIQTRRYLGERRMIRNNPGENNLCLYVSDINSERKV